MKHKPGIYIATQMYELWAIAEAAESRVKELTKELGVREGEYQAKLDEIRKVITSKGNVTFLSDTDKEIDAILDRGANE